MARAVVLTVEHVETLVGATGVWRDCCNLPSGVDVTITLCIGGLLSSRKSVRCMDCGRWS